MNSFSLYFIIFILIRNIICYGSLRLSIYLFCKPTQDRLVLQFTKINLVFYIYYASKTLSLLENYITSIHGEVPNKKMRNLFTEMTIWLIRQTWITRKIILHLLHDFILKVKRSGHESWKLQNLFMVGYTKWCFFFLFTLLEPVRITRIYFFLFWLSYTKTKTVYLPRKYRRSFISVKKFHMGTLF